MRVVLDTDCFMPERAHELDAGLDLRTPTSCDIPPGGSKIINTGVHVQIPEGFAGVIISKSGLNMKHGIIATGLIDAGYTGPIKVKLYNMGTELYRFDRGDKVTQMVIIPVMAPSLEQVDALDYTDRGDSGFGSSGR